MPLDLPFARLAAHLNYQVADLTDAGRTHRMALRFESPARVDRPWTRQRCAALQRVRTSVAFLYESEVLGRDDFGDGEAIVDFGELNVLRSDARHLVCLLAGRGHGPECCNVVLFVRAT